MKTLIVRVCVIATIALLTATARGNVAAKPEPPPAVHAARMGQPQGVALGLLLRQHWDWATGANRRQARHTGWGLGGPYIPLDPTKRPPVK